MELDILGTTYKVAYKDFAEDPLFEKNGISGYHSPYDTQIVVCSMKTHPEFLQGNDEVIRNIERTCLRHEIIHAFLHESGLADSAIRPEESWAMNEEMVDWFALQAPKIFKVFKAADCL